MDLLTLLAALGSQEENEWREFEFVKHTGVIIDPEKKVQPTFERIHVVIVGKCGGSQQTLDRACDLYKQGFTVPRMNTCRPSPYTPQMEVYCKACHKPHRMYRLA